MIDYIKSDGGQNDATAEYYALEKEYRKSISAIGSLLSVLKNELPMLGDDLLREEARIIRNAEKVYRKGK